MDGGNSRVLRQQIAVPQERVVIGLQLTSLDMIDEWGHPSIHDVRSALKGEGSCLVFVVDILFE